MPKIRVGVVGVGHLGSLHAKSYKDNKDCTLTALCDIDQQKLKVASEQLGVCAYSDFRDIFAQVDAISIAVPAKLHYRIAAEFLKHKIHTLVEKPFTTNLKEADNLIKIAKKNKLILQVGHIERFNSAFAATQKLINHPKFIECHRLSPFPHRSLDVGVVLDMMIHDLDIVLGLVDSPVKRIYAVGVNVLTALEDIANARLQFANGCVANLTASRVSDEAMRKIRIFQEDTYISLDYKQAQASVYKRTGLKITRHQLPIENAPPLQKELQSFIDSVREHKEPLVSGPVAREALWLALEIQAQIWKKNKS